jgi:hypothetical protein
MATLTYDGSDPNAPEFTPDEQDSLARGEAQFEAEQQLLAGKYKDAEALEAAYIELQQKLGETDEGSEDNNAEEGEPEEEYVQEDDEEEEVDEEGGYSDEDIEIIQNVAGGPEEYDNLLKWAAGTLNQQEINMFDHVIGLNDPYAAFFAVNMLKNAYDSTQDSDGELITGGRSADPVDQFLSQAQVVEAMSDPRYDRDPAYRDAVMRKLENSNIQY